MDKRTIEIQFYYYILHLLKAFDNNVCLFDIIEGLGLACDFKANVIWNLFLQVYRKQAYWIPTSEEQVLHAKQLRISFRKTRDITGIDPNTQYRILDTLRNDPSQIPSQEPRLDDKIFLEVHKFVQAMDKLKGGFNGYIDVRD